MQTKIAIFQAHLFVRQQGGSEANDDFFTFARKFIEQQEATYIFKQEMDGTLLASPQMIKTLVCGNPAIFKVTLERLLASTEKFMPN